MNWPSANMVEVSREEEGVKPQETVQRRTGRRDREKKILIGLVEYFIRTGKPVGSQSLQEAGFSDVSSATIRNYFTSLEKEGFLKQQHVSGGRIPQPKAFREYAHLCLEEVSSEDGAQGEESSVIVPEHADATNVVTFIQHFAEALSQKIGGAIAISAPRFDHDVVTDLRFVFLDVSRTLAVIITEFGLVHTAVISTPFFSFTHTFLKKADRFARSRLFQETLEQDMFEGNELEEIRRIYQEAMASYFVSYSSVSQEDLWRTGFARLIQNPEFAESSSLAAPLSLFENGNALRGCMRDAIRANTIRFWIGEDLLPYVIGEPNCALFVIPYSVGSRPVGAIALVTSMRLLFSPLFRLLKSASTELSLALTKSLMHHRISYRMPESHAVFTKESQQLALNFEKKTLLDHSRIQTRSS